MSALTALGIASLLFVVGFSWRAWVQADTAGGVRQSRRESLIEAFFGIVIGFSINFGMNFLLLPLVGVQVTSSQNLWLGAIYTSVSLLRSFLIRRFFAARIHQFAAHAAERIA